RAVSCPVSKMATLAARTAPRSLWWAAPDPPDRHHDSTVSTARRLATSPAACPPIPSATMNSGAWSSPSGAQAPAKSSLFSRPAPGSETYAHSTVPDAPSEASWPLPASDGGTGTWCSSAGHMASIVPYPVPPACRPERAGASGLTEGGQASRGSGGGGADCGDSGCSGWWKTFTPRILGLAITHTMPRTIQAPTIPSALYVSVDDAPPALIAR